MFSQNADLCNFNNMEYCANKYSGHISNQSWSIEQSRQIAKSQLWPQPAPTPNPVQNTLMFNRANLFQASAIPKSQGINVSESFRKQASVSDWEAYLYSPSSNTAPSDPTISEKYMSSEATRNPNRVIPKENHRAHISFVYTPQGVFKPVVKRKRKRTSFTTEQVQALEAIFYKRPYVSREERQHLMEKLQISDKAIKVWFQNRRLKVKKEKEEQESSDSETYEVQETNSLAYVESQIYKADRFGYVTLDDRAVTELVNVIDYHLPIDADLGNTAPERPEPMSRLCSVSESECSAIYEPISPPDLTDGASQENFTQKWEPFEAIEPKKSLQNLLDVHMYDYNESKLSVF